MTEPPSCAEVKKAAEAERERLYAFSTDYLKRDGPTRGMLMHRGFHALHVPRPLLVCRALGHRTVVDGTKGMRPGRAGYRWVCCDRCGLRAKTHAPLDPDRWGIGDVYGERVSWPRATGTLAAEIVVGKHVSGASAGVAIGCAGDENTVAAHVLLSPLGALYVHTERFGTWFQRRLNAVGYDTRVIEASVGDGRLRWRLWAKQGEYSMSTPRWRDGSVVVDPRERILGPVLYSYDPVGEPVTAVVRMPEGDDHKVVLSLRRVRRGRKRGDGVLSWSADWSSEKGIPFRSDSSWKGNEVTASAVEVSAASAEHGRWAEEAIAAIAVQVSAMRTRYRWRPEVATTGAADPQGTD